MACMNKAPRSANVSANRECYVLEMVRNVFHTIRKDPLRKFLMDEIYRKRVLDLHLRELSVFKCLNEKQMQKVRDRVKLQEIDPGTILFEEHDEPDACYVIRSGLVKVVKNLHCKLQLDEFSDQQWNKVWSLLAVSPPKRDRLAATVLGEFPRMRARLDARLKKLEGDRDQILKKLSAVPGADPEKARASFQNDEQEIQRASTQSSRPRTSSISSALGQRADHDQERSRPDRIDRSRGPGRGNRGANDRCSSRKCLGSGQSRGGACKECRRLGLSGQSNFRRRMPVARGRTGNQRVAARS